LSLTTVSTPHLGSAFAEACFKLVGGSAKVIYSILEGMGISTGAFTQLTRIFMQQEFNPVVPDLDRVKYFSYGAMVDSRVWSAFRFAISVIEDEEGPNDGMVSVDSAKWGVYKGTIADCSHLDLVNWPNRMRWLYLEWTGRGKRTFNALAFYLAVSDMLAKEGL
jgi:triacylglycerol lipase